MQETFVEHRFSLAGQQMIKRINLILDDYASQGFRLSLRQLYYQLVSKALIENSVKSYKNIGSLVSDARLAGLIDWDRIEDRGRNTVQNSHWRNPGEILRSAAYSFAVDKWRDQSWHVEVMVEKDALSGVLGPVCAELDISLTANKGYSSSSTMYEIGQRLNREYEDWGKDICIIYLGDHDPSGIDMTRDISERLALFSRLDCIEVVRLALNIEQVRLWNPPENPAKETDSRFEKYVEKFGESSWELDAVEPATLAQLVREEVLNHRDEEKWQEAVRTEERYKNELVTLSRKYL